MNYGSSQAEADEVVREIVARDGKALAVQADMARPADIERLFAETKAAFGAPNILVTTRACIAFRAAPTELTTRAPDIGVACAGRFLACDKTRGCQLQAQARRKSFPDSHSGRQF